MAKNKQHRQKKKERERRVAQKKLAAAQKRHQAQKQKEVKKSVPKTIKPGSITAPKTEYVANDKDSPFTQKLRGS